MEAGARSPVAGGTCATMRLAATSNIGVFTSLMYRHAAAGSKFAPEMSMSEPGAGAGLLPAPPPTTAIEGTGRAVSVNVTGATPGTDAVTVTVPADAPSVAVILAMPLGPVEATVDESVAPPCETEKAAGANGYTILPCASSLTTSGRSRGAVASRDCLSPDTISRRSAGIGVSTRIRWLPESAKHATARNPPPSPAARSTEP